MKRLNNGVEMPDIGFGVFRMSEQDCEQAVLFALDAGYRWIDTAMAYGNEGAVGRAIKRSGIAREELFISTKLWVTDTNEQRAQKGLEESLERLGLDYVDLYFIHQPYNDYYGAWRVLEKMVEQGKVRALGVDNFKQDRLADFLFFQKMKPQANMIECNPLFQREDERQYLESEDILMQAWSPLAAGQTDLFQDPILVELAKTYQKSPAQIILHWLVQRGIAPVVKSQNPKRIKENIDIFDFSLTPKEMETIASMDTKHSYTVERNTAKTVREFLELAQSMNG